MNKDRLCAKIDQFRQSITAANELIVDIDDAMKELVCKESLRRKVGDTTGADAYRRAYRLLDMKRDSFKHSVHTLETNIYMVEEILKIESLFS